MSQDWTYPADARLRDRQGDHGSTRGGEGVAAEYLQGALVVRELDSFDAITTGCVEGVVFVVGREVEGEVFG
jgi:hypothetical protein